MINECLYCCLCFDTLTPEECYTDPIGQKWDVCKSCGEMEEQARASKEPDATL